VDSASQARTHTKRTLSRRCNIVISSVGAILLFQVLYPGDRMLPLEKVGATHVGTWLKQDAAKKLEKQLANSQINVYIGDSKSAYTTIKPKDIGLSMNVSKSMPSSEYPWYVRIVPTSILWFQLLQPNPNIGYSRNEKIALQFLESDLATSCVLPAKNASLKFNGKDFDVVSAREGGTCKKSDAMSALANVSPSFSGVASARIPAEVSQPKIHDADAQKLADKLMSTSKSGVSIIVGKTSQNIPQTEVLSWLSFTTKSSELTFNVDATKSKKYFSSNVTPKIAKQAGTTYISTQDFTILSKKVGATGQTLNTTATLATIEDVLNGDSEAAKAMTADSEAAKAMTAPLKPNVVYRRSYTSTSTGISALITHYDDEHAGDFGVAFSELSGQSRSASHQATRQFTTASTYKLFVAYGTLRNVDSGKWKWSMQVQGGRNLTKCFDDMIVKSDNACAEALLKKLGYSKLTNDIRALGLSQSGFVTGDTPLTTAGDLTLFLTKLQKSLRNYKTIRLG